MPPICGDSYRLIAEDHTPAGKVLGILSSLVVVEVAPVPAVPLVAGGEGGP